MSNTNQFTLGYKAGLKAAVKVCRKEMTNGIEYKEWDEACSACANYIKDLPVPEVQWRDLTDDEISDAIHGKGSPLRLFDSSIRAYRAVIAAFKEKQL